MFVILPMTEIGRSVFVGNEMGHDAQPLARFIVELKRGVGDGFLRREERVGKFGAELVLQTFACVADEEIRPLVVRLVFGG